jgi:hypothetical protein
MPLAVFEPSNWNAGTTGWAESLRSIITTQLPSSTDKSIADDLNAKNRQVDHFHGNASNAAPQSKLVFPQTEAMPSPVT